jgi:hypothetical protein
MRVKKSSAILTCPRHFSVSSSDELFEKSETRGMKAAWYASHYRIWLAKSFNNE